jgi:hypothetical protein
MKLYYTISNGEPNESQSTPSLSLGGFLSSSLVKNNSLDNLFGEITPYTITKEQDEYIGLMLVNDTGGDITGVNVWFDHPEDSYSKFYILGVLPATNGDGDKYIEAIPDRFSQPVYGTFEEADVNNKYSLGDIVDGDIVGVWIKRELLLDFISTDSNDVYEEDPENTDRYIAKEKNTSDSISINISWD